MKKVEFKKGDAVKLVDPENKEVIDILTDAGWSGAIKEEESPAPKKRGRKPKKVESDDDSA